jgi:phenylacetic acid degradation protein paaN
MPQSFFARHQDLLAAAVHAVDSRGAWSAFSDNIKTYGDGAIDTGREAFEAYRDAQFYLDQPGVVGRGGGEESPWGLSLNVSYPKCSPDALLAAGKAAMTSWIKAGPDSRAGLCAEMLARLNAMSAEMAQAVMHTTGQSFTLAFQYGGPLAQERGLEAVALAWREMKHVPYRAVWERPQGMAGRTRIDKRFTVLPRGVALVVGSSTLPNWCAYPGLFASLVTGNAVIVKPSPSAILPLAITVAVIRTTLKEAGFDPNLVSLLVDTAAAPVTKDIALRPDVRIIDFSGSPDFGRWLEDSARQAVVFTEKRAIDCVVIEATADYAGLLKGLALTLCLNSGQFVATPRALLVAREGVHTPQGVVGSDRFGHDLAAAISQLLEDPVRAVEVLGAIQSAQTIEGLDRLAAQTDALRESSVLHDPDWPDARIRSPLLLRTALGEMIRDVAEHFGPVYWIVETATTSESLAIAERLAREYGGINLSVHSANEQLLQLAEDAAWRAGMALSINLTSTPHASQTAAFSDYQATGANPAANACRIDSAFVTTRFYVAQVRRQVA